ncbi:hypothetical protein BDQ17DRAFT_478574 [Cyathus striatus]|nr:hypothetical protein BDQ17DRAFT_478574 [Cyathus striatus]
MFWRLRPNQRHSSGILTEDELLSLSFRKELFMLDKDEYRRERGLFVAGNLDDMFRRANIVDSGVRDYSPYILRNLSKKAYVRGFNPPWCVRGKCTFGQTLFARICWSSDPSTNMAHYPKDVPEITRGLWAGDRFDIVPLQEVDAVLEIDGWEDVTEELKGHVERIFEVNMAFASDSTEEENQPEDYVPWEDWVSSHIIFG